MNKEILHPKFKIRILKIYHTNNYGFPICDLSQGLNFEDRRFDKAKLSKIINYLTWGGNVPKNNLVAFLKKATKLSILVLPRPQIPN